MRQESDHQKGANHPKVGQGVDSERSLDLLWRRLKKRFSRRNSLYVTSTNDETSKKGSNGKGEVIEALTALFTTISTKS